MMSIYVAAVQCVVTHSLLASIAFVPQPKAKRYANRQHNHQRRLGEALRGDART
jgi:hypothetical protein